MRISPDQGLQFAQMLVQDEEPLADITQVRNKRGEKMKVKWEVEKKGTKGGEFKCFREKPCDPEGCLSYLMNSEGRSLTNCVFLPDC